MGFWDNLPRPILALAPMANVTDAAFRRVIAKYGKPDIMFTEFTSADGLMSKGREALLVDLLYSESERPIVAQLFSGNPERIFEAAKLVRELGFDGLDINMGCPDRSIEKSGAGAALIKNPRLAREIIRAAKEGVAFPSPFPKGSTASSQEGFKSSTSEDSATSFSKGGIKSNVPIPISIKTRLGYNKDILEEWLPELLAEKPAAITIHARTRKEMSKVPAHWERVKKAVEIRDAFFASPPFQGGDKRGGSQTLILGNGDVKDLADAHAKAKETGADGIMLGRAVFGNPWLFAGSSSLFSKGSTASSAGGILTPPVSEDGVTPLVNGELSPLIVQRLRVTVEHTKLFEELLGKHESFAIMKKHFKAYVEGFDGAKELRMKLMQAENASEVEDEVKTFLSKREIAL